MVNMVVKMGLHSGLDIRLHIRPPLFPFIPCLSLYFVISVIVMQLGFGNA
jgi:hypothetical protein